MLKGKSFLKLLDFTTYNRRITIFTRFGKKIEGR